MKNKLVVFFLLQSIISFAQFKYPLKDILSNEEKEKINQLTLQGLAELAKDSLMYRQKRGVEYFMLNIAQHMIEVQKDEIIDLLPKKLRHKFKKISFRVDTLDIFSTTHVMFVEKDNVIKFEHEWYANLYDYFRLNLISNPTTGINREIFPLIYGNTKLMNKNVTAEEEANLTIQENAIINSEEANLSTLLAFHTCLMLCYLHEFGHIGMSTDDEIVADSFAIDTYYKLLFKRYGKSRKEVAVFNNNLENINLRNFLNTLTFEDLLGLQIVNYNTALDFLDFETITNLKTFHKTNTLTSKRRKKLYNQISNLVLNNSSNTFQEIIKYKLDDAESNSRNVEKMTTIFNHLDTILTETSEIKKIMEDNNPVNPGGLAIMYAGQLLKREKFELALNVLKSALTTINTEKWCAEVANICISKIYQYHYFDKANTIKYLEYAEFIGTIMPKSYYKVGLEKIKNR